jgi:MFS superfamily sulfate permease-like transporter
MNPYPCAIVIAEREAPHPLLAGFMTGVALVMVIAVVAKLCAGRLAGRSE